MGILKSSLRDELLSFVPKDGTSIGNGNLLAKLGWDLDQYQKIRAELVEDKILQLGRGRGGSVSLRQPKETSFPQEVVPTGDPVSGSPSRGELSLYADFR